MHVAEAKAAAHAVGAEALDIDDERYPALLRAIHDPPPLLFIRGDPALLRAPLLAVVGSRRASPAGLRVAQTLSGQLVGAGLHICSGLALGIDGAAHRGALAAGGKSVAVMATGIDRVYPQRHHALAAQLQQAGCLVTEFPPGTPALKHNFPKRNRIISGLSLGVLVVEAALPSGSPRHRKSLWSRRYFSKNSRLSPSTRRMIGESYCCSASSPRCSRFSITARGSATPNKWWCDCNAWRVAQSRFLHSLAAIWSAQNQTSHCRSSVISRAALAVIAGRLKCYRSHAEGTEIQACWGDP